MNGREPFLAAAATLLAESGCTVREWRNATSGKAWTRADDWGIAVPEPRGPISYGVFAHEVGHQMLHRHNSTPRWVEEIEAWEYALASFARFSLPRLVEAQALANQRVGYSCGKALRRSKDPGALRERVEWRLQEWPAETLAALERDVARWAGRVK